MERQFGPLPPDAEEGMQIEPRPWGGGHNSDQYVIDYADITLCALCALLMYPWIFVSQYQTCPVSLAAAGVRRDQLNHGREVMGG